MLCGRYFTLWVGLLNLEEVELITGNPPENKFSVLCSPCPYTFMRNDAGVKLGPAYLFFGCRKRSQDYIYEEELKAWAKDGTITRLFVAFSRDGKHKDYVQHHMECEAKLIAPVLTEAGDGHFYVCGDAKHMAKVGLGRRHMCLPARRALCWIPVCH